MKRTNQLQLGWPVLAVIPLLFVACASTRADKISIAQAPAISSPKFQDESGITVVYPRGDKVPAASTYVAGATPPGTSLTCNGAPVHLSPEGFFAHVVPLKPGMNTILLQQQPTGRTREVKVEREIAATPIAVSTCKIDAASLQPKSDRGVVLGDTIEFSAHATPGSSVSAVVGKRKIDLHQIASVSGGSRARKRNATRTGKKSQVNRGLDAAFGNVYQRSSSAPSDLYAASYKVQPEDHWNASRIKYTLHSNSGSTSQYSEGRLTTVTQPISAETSHDKTIVRTGPGLGRITPLPAGVRLLIDGWQDDSMRCVYAPNHHYWIKKDELFQSPAGQAETAPNSVARTINVSADDYGTIVAVPLSQKLPFLIEQQLKPSKLVLKIFGATADTDWITPALNAEHPQLVDHIVWKQVGDGIYEVTVLLKSSRQWGFKADYTDTNLLLHIKAPPKLGKGHDRLHGLKICVDPGHGGSESGAIGCSGVREAEINLAISMKVKSELEAAGAHVTMTRTDNKDVSLEDRVSIAEAANVDILLSVHNNSLPDGRDPLTEHGASSYWYHPQSIQMARLMKDKVVKETGFPDFGTRFQNLALTRPSSMLSMLVEVGFVISPEEYAQLISESGQQKAAQGIVGGLIDYLNPPPLKK